MQRGGGHVVADADHDAPVLVGASLAEEDCTRQHTRDTPLRIKVSVRTDWNLVRRKFAQPGQAHRVDDDQPVVSDGEQQHGLCLVERVVMGLLDAERVHCEAGDRRLVVMQDHFTLTVIAAPQMHFL